MMYEEKTERLRGLYDDEWSGCQRCPLHENLPVGQEIVFGEGNPDAHLMIVAGHTVSADLRNRSPMDGPCGEVVDAFLDFNSSSRESVFITNITACPAKTKTAAEKKAAAAGLRSCVKRVHALLRIVDPFVVLVLGQEAFKLLVSSGGTLKSVAKDGYLRSTQVTVPGVMVPIEWPAVATFHPEHLYENWSDKEGSDAHLAHRAWERAFSLAGLCAEAYRGATPLERRIE